MPSKHLQRIIFVAIAITGSAWLLYLFDDGLGIGWPSNALRNWQQYGLFTLNGSLVTNPGGFEAESHPDIYHGMSPVYLYPVFFSTQLFDWTGLGTLSFHVLLASLVCWGIWSLLGRNSLALLVGALVILCPGYGRWQMILDPNVLAVLLGIPYSAVVIHILKTPKLRWGHVLILAFLTLAYVPLNWTTAWFLAPFGVFLLVWPLVRRPVVLKFLALTGAASVLFVIVSVSAKTSGSPSAAGSAPAGHFLGGYAWGMTGYYSGLSNLKIFTRIFCVTLVGLLPLIIAWLWKSWRHITIAQAKGWSSLLPVAVAALEIGVMRNYFGHHPWMAGPVIIVGLIFSLAMQTNPAAENDQPVKNSKRERWGWTLAAGSLIYGLVVLACVRANSNESYSLVHLVREKTNRSDCIVIVKNMDPATANIARRLDDLLDRHVLLVDDLRDVPRGGKLVVLSAVACTNDLQIVGQASVEIGNGISHCSDAAIQWFNRAIARRKAGDKLEFSPQYFLYRPLP